MKIKFNRELIKNENRNVDVKLDFTKAKKEKTKEISKLVVSLNKQKED